MSTLPKISQSLIKAYYDFVNDKMCGKHFEALYITRTHNSIPSEAMNLGTYFEFLCTGSLPRDGKIPLAKFLKTGANKGELTQPYANAKKASELFAKIIKHYNIKILETGLKVSTDDCDGILDIFAEWNGQKVIIDEKYSGVIDDKWNEYGFDVDSLHMKDTLMIQGVHYKYLMKEAYGIDDIPFYFFVFDASNPEYAKIILENVDPDKMELHKNLIQDTKTRMAYDIKRGFQYRPKLEECIDCPLKLQCPKATDVPIIERVDY